MCLARLGGSCAEKTAARQSGNRSESRARAFLPSFLAFFASEASCSLLEGISLAQLLFMVQLLIFRDMNSLMLRLARGRNSWARPNSLTDVEIHAPEHIPLLASQLQAPLYGGRPGSRLSPITSDSEAAISPFSRTLRADSGHRLCSHHAAAAGSMCRKARYWSSPSRSPPTWCGPRSLPPPRSASRSSSSGCMTRENLLAIVNKFQLFAERGRSCRARSCSIRCASEHPHAAVRARSVAPAKRCLTIALDGRIRASSAPRSRCGWRTN